jgi:hypothetical protein
MCRPQLSPKTQLLSTFSGCAGRSLAKDSAFISLLECAGRSLAKNSAFYQPFGVCRPQPRQELSQKLGFVTR